MSNSAEQGRRPRSLSHFNTVVASTFETVVIAAKSTRSRPMTPRIISEGSPLDRLPAGLDHAQRGWLEGLRYSVEIADLSMRRLRGLLLDLVGRASVAGESQQVILDPDAYTAVVADAWTFLDATWRLKRFLVDGRLPRPPGPPQEPPEETDVTLDLSRFEDALTDVKAARDGFQHFDDQAARIAGERKPVWGYINWAVISPETKTVHTCLLVPGGLPPGSTKFSFVNPAGKPFHPPVDHILLHAFDKSIDLTELHRQLADVTQRLETILRPQFEGSEVNAATFLVLIKLSCGSKGEPEPTVGAAG